MKRISIAIVVLFALAAPLLAQAASAATAREPSEYYPIRLEVVKVYSNAAGYRVVYRKGGLGFGELYVPIEWFKAGGKASLIAGDDNAFPTAVVFFKAGTFSHVKLYVRSSRKDPTWGSLGDAAGLADKFKVTELKPEF